MTESVESPVQLPVEADWRWRDALQDSWVSRVFGEIGRYGLNLVKPCLEESWWVRHVDALALGSVGLLFFFSPLVGTGINAALVLLAFFLLSLRWVVQPQTRASWAVVDFAILAFVMVHLISTCFSAYWLASVKGLLKMVIYWLAYFSFRQVLTIPGALRAVLLAVMAAGTLQAGLGVYQWLIGVEPLANWEDPEALDPLTRVYGSLMNPNLLAGYLLPIFALLLAHAFTWRGVWRWVASLAAVLLLTCIFFTYSRGAYLAAIAEVAVFAIGAMALGWPRIQRKGLVLVGSMGAGAVLALAALYKVWTSPSLLARLTSIFTLRGHSSNSFRMNVWTGVIHMVADNLWIGVGVGNTAFRKIYSLYMISGFEALGAYNIFLEVTAEMGLVGLIVFIALLAVAFNRTRLLLGTGEWSQRWLGLAILAALTGMVVMGMVDTVYYRPAVQLQFWLLLALAWGIGPSAYDASSGGMTPDERQRLV